MSKKDDRERTGGAHFCIVYGPNEVTINRFATRLDDWLALPERTGPCLSGAVSIQRVGLWY